MNRMVHREQICCCGREVRVWMTLRGDTDYDDTGCTCPPVELEPIEHSDARMRNVCMDCGAACRQPAKRCLPCSNAFHGARNRDQTRERMRRLAREARA